MTLNQYNICLQNPIETAKGFFRKLADIFLMSVKGKPDSVSCLSVSRERQFESLVHDYYDLIGRICFGYAKTKEELDDLRQDTLVNIRQGMSKFRGDSSWQTWIYRVTLNTCVSTLRKSYKMTGTSSIESLYDLVDETEERRQQVKEMHEMIALLNPVDRALMLMWLDEFSYDEMSDMTGMPRNTVATRLRRAKQRICEM